MRCPKNVLRINEGMRWLLPCKFAAGHRGEHQPDSMVEKKDDDAREIPEVHQP
jgi:hypothetical protein